MNVAYRIDQESVDNLNFDVQRDHWNQGLLPNTDFSRDHNVAVNNSGTWNDHGVEKTFSVNGENNFSISVSGPSVTISQELSFEYSGPAGIGAPWLESNFTLDTSVFQSLLPFYGFETNTLFLANASLKLDLSGLGGMVTESAIQIANDRAFGTYIKTKYANVSMTSNHTPPPDYLFLNKEVSAGTIGTTEFKEVKDYSDPFFSSLDDVADSSTIISATLKIRPPNVGTTGSWTGSGVIRSEVTLRFEEFADTNVTALPIIRYTGPEDTPSSKLEFDWIYQGGTDFSGSDPFTASLYYSTDEVFDSSDVAIGFSQTIVADSKDDSGTGVFDFGSRPLQPDKERPYVLVVLDNDEPKPLPADNVSAVMLPHVDIKEVLAENTVKASKRWYSSTLMRPTSFIVDRPEILLNEDVTIEYRRIDTPLEGETNEWTKFDDDTLDAIQGIHRLAGIFEFRAVVDVGGVKFTSENYHGAIKRKKKDLFPIIAVLFPTGEELAANSSIKSMAYDKWKEIDNWIIAQNLELAKEAQTYVYLDTSSSPDSPRYVFIAEMNNGTIVEWKESPPQPMLGVVDADGVGQPRLLPPLKDRLTSTGGTASALYLVAHLHTHPRYDYPDPGPVESRSVIKSKPGASTGHNGNDGDTLEIKNLSKTIKIDLVGLVYDFVGEILNIEGHSLNGEYVTYAGYDYGADPGRLYAYGSIRRRDRK